MPQCSRCGRTKPADQFTWNRSKSRADTYCRPCRAEYGREHYIKYKKRYVQNAAARTRRVYEARLAWLVNYFATHPCKDCGETDPLVLEFDHLTDKSFNLARGFKQRNWEAVRKEMEKCEVVCSNCHRRRTATRGGFGRAKVIQLLQAERDKEEDKGPWSEPRTLDERATGNDPASLAWKARALPLSYARNDPESTDAGVPRAKRSFHPVIPRRGRRGGRLSSPGPGQARLW